MKQTQKTHSLGLLNRTRLAPLAVVRYGGYWKATVRRRERRSVYDKSLLWSARYNENAKIGSVCLLVRASRGRQVRLKASPRHGQGVASAFDTITQ